MLRRFMDFQGRIGRMPYALAQIPVLLVTVPMGLLIITAVINPAFLFGPNGGPWVAALLVLLTLSVPLTWFSYSQAAKRLHDLNLSGWFSILYLVPFLSWFFGMYLLFAPGTGDENRFGWRDNG